MSEYDRLESKIDKYESYVKYSQHFTEEYNNKCLEYIKDIIYIYDYRFYIFSMHTSISNRALGLAFRFHFSGSTSSGQRPRCHRP